MKNVIVALMLGAFAWGCHSGDIRGSSKPFHDGKTYLVVADANGGTCPLKLDGKLWASSTKGVVYTFDYWGP